MIPRDEGSRGFGIRMATPALNYYYDYETPVLSGKWRGIGFGGYYPRNDTVDTRVSCVPETLTNDASVWVYRCARSYIAIPRMYAAMYTPFACVTGVVKCELERNPPLNFNVLI